MVIKNHMSNELKRCKRQPAGIDRLKLNLCFPEYEYKTIMQPYKSVMLGRSDAPSAATWY